MSNIKGPTPDQLPDTEVFKQGLCLTRKPGASVLISHPDGEIEVLVVNSGFKECRLLFIQESRATKIIRKELKGTCFDLNWKAKD